MAASPPQHIFMLQSNNDDSVTQQVLLTFSSKKRGLQPIPIIKSSEDGQFKWKRASNPIY